MNADRCPRCGDGPVLPFQDGYDEDFDSFETGQVCHSCTRVVPREQITREWVRERLALLEARR
jgi:hypothetical protein